MNRVKKRFLFGLCFVCWMAVSSSQAWALTLSFVPSGSIINVGDSVDINIDISGMDSAYLGDFDLDVSYDNSILAFNSYSLGDGLGDISAGEAIDFSLGDPGGGGVIDLAEVSLLLDLSFQLDSFTLATVSFTGISPGTSALSFSDVILGDDLGELLSADTNTGSVSASSAPVPEPATGLLYVFGIIGIAGITRKMSKK